MLHDTPPALFCCQFGISVCSADSTIWFSYQHFCVYCLCLLAKLEMPYWLAQWWSYLGMGRPSGDASVMMLLWYWHIMKISGGVSTGNGFVCTHSADVELWTDTGCDDAQPFLCPKHSVFFTASHIDNCVRARARARAHTRTHTHTHTHTHTSFNDNQPNNSRVLTVEVKMVEETLLSTEEKRSFELSTPEHVRPQGMGENECSEMVTCVLQADSFNQVTADHAVKDADGSHTHNPKACAAPHSLMWTIHIPSLIIMCSFLGLSQMNPQVHFVISYTQ